MSRIALITIGLVAAPARAAPHDPLASYRAITSVAVRCSGRPSETAITVCGRRAADRWRVPFLTVEPGDPAHRTVMEERNALIPTMTPCQDHSIFLVGCGRGVGVHAVVGLGADTDAVRVRPLAD